MTANFHTNKSGAIFNKLLCVGLLLGAASLAAQGLKDPTQPPPAWLAAKAREAAGPVKSAPAQAKVAIAKEPEAPPPLQLQTLRVGGPRNYAVINGQLLSEGDSIEGIKVTSVSASQVVLGSGATTRILKLYPDIEKTGMK